MTDINPNQKEYELEGVVIEAEDVADAQPKTKSSWRKYWWLALLFLLIVFSWWLSNVSEGELQQQSTHKELAQKKLIEAKKIAKQKQIERKKSQELIARKHEIQQEQIVKQTIEDNSNQEVKESAIKAIIQADAESDKIQQMQLKIKNIKQQYAKLKQVTKLNNNLMAIYLELQIKLMNDDDVEQYLTKILANDDLPENIAMKLRTLLENIEGIKLKNSVLKQKLRLSIDEYYNKNPIYQSDNGFLRWFNHHVKIKKIGAEHDGDDFAIIAKMDNAMQNNDLNAALNIAQSLSVNAAPYFNAWQQLAYQHINANQAMQDLTKLMQHRLSKNEFVRQ